LLEPGVESDMMVVTACRNKNGVSAIPLLDLKAQ